MNRRPLTCRPSLDAEWPVLDSVSLIPAFLPLAFLAVGLVVTGCSSSPDSQNDSYRLLRSVPVPVNYITTNATGGLELDEGQVLKHQTYTIDSDGQFTLDRLIESEVGSIGASFTSLSPPAAERVQMEPYTGVLVRSIRSKGPASRAGIRSRDVILSFAGESVTNRDHLVHLIESASPGEQVAVEFNHDGQISSTTIEIVGEARTEVVRALQRRLPVLDDRSRSGLKIVELPRDVHSIVVGEATERGGLLVLELLPGGPSFFSELRVRDVITGVNGQPVATHADYLLALSNHRPGDKVDFQARRGEGLIETTVTLDQDAMSSSGFNLLNLVKYRRKPEEREFSMIWSILFHSEKSHSVVKRDNIGQHTTRSNWGAFLDLLHYRRSPRKTQFDLLWIFPITFRNDEES